MRRMALRIAAALLGLLFVVAGTQVRVCAQEGSTRSNFRTWTSTSGHTTKATFDSFDGERVRLKKEDGTFVRLEIDKLSEADRQYVVAQTNGRGQSEEGASGKSPSDSGETSELLVKCQQLSQEIAKRYRGRAAGGKAKVAVVEFSDLSGGVTEFGRLLSEELITKLSNTGDYTVVERLLLNKAIAEHKLQLQGIIDPKSAKELGKILGVDAIISGTIADLGNSLRVNARVISTETGEVLSSAAVSVNKDDTIKGLLAKASGEPTTSGSDGSSSPPDGKNGHGMSVEKATAVGTRYIGTISYRETVSRLVLEFTEQDDFLIRAEARNPDILEEKQVFTGKLIRNPQSESGGDAYPIVMSPVAAKTYYGGGSDTTAFYYSSVSLKLRLTDTGLEGEAKPGPYGAVYTIRLKPGTAGSVRSPKKPSVRPKR